MKGPALTPTTGCSRSPIQPPPGVESQLDLFAPGAPTERGLGPTLAG